MLTEENYNREAVILAGGLGTRLRSVVADVPKCMAPVNGKPFISYILNYLQTQNIDRFIFSLGYKHDVVSKYISLHYPKLNAEFVIEEEPLGTGGAIQLVLQKAMQENVVVTNGDTMFDVDIKALLDLHTSKKSECTLSLKPMQNFERYGVVEVDERQRITEFKEKQFYKAGLINGGLYVVDVSSYLGKHLPAKHSFEKDYLEKFYKEKQMFGLVQDKYFIDIGIPEDFERAQKEL